MVNRELRNRLAREETALRVYIRRRAGSAAHFEEIDDLAQSVMLRALDNVEGESFQDDEHMRAWLFTIASNYLSDRREHWRTLKRGSAKVARLTLSGASGEGVPIPKAPESGPQTRASRRELIVLTSRALAALPERDQTLIRWRSEGLPIEKQAEHLGVTYEAAQRAGHRAFDRFRKVFELAARS
ncbi:MAG: sigma-70 family RNA polymerase sigma factor [Planctomycetota bacterium]